MLGTAGRCPRRGQRPRPHIGTRRPLPGRDRAVADARRRSPLWLPPTPGRRRRGRPGGRWSSEDSVGGPGRDRGGPKSEGPTRDCRPREQNSFYVRCVRPKERWRCSPRRAAPAANRRRGLGVVEPDAGRRGAGGEVRSPAPERGSTRRASPVGRTSTAVGHLGEADPLAFGEHTGCPPGPDAGRWPRGDEDFSRADIGPEHLERWTSGATEAGQLIRLPRARSCHPEGPDPAASGCRPVITLNAVVLPAPLGPNQAVIVPASADRPPRRGDDATEANREALSFEHRRLRARFDRHATRMARRPALHHGAAARTSRATARRCRGPPEGLRASPGLRPGPDIRCCRCSA